MHNPFRKLTPGELYEREVDKFIRKLRKQYRKLGIYIKEPS